ncbi:NAD(P)H-dependent oxidoreductase [Lentilactobacillus sp. SPB1-3]|uniref:NAD(P)H-dependent oxidoreductase n=1 Tax=Lentilactobacillus terminaliae TaxID=3003483 RepID=A0ACD5DDI8_9LACO|nr:NAD(P)H-dependent oxidoreductase [Lentilactobacillus sp. SPB1-3]MCZ0977716.1 NAD(P)H-dependent oxidoreductase [Lentilactobacillus sp. SPB1-3]
MKNICIIFDHPYTATAYDNEPHHRSFSAALLQKIKDGVADNDNVSLDVIDLHADNFDPVMHEADLSTWRRRQPINEQVANYQERLLAADEIFFVFPIWWESMPAMTKGFIDKVIAPGMI